MANNETTTKFKVDISDLKKAMTEARKQVAYANSEFKEASSSMDDWSKSSDGISAKLKQLNSNLKSQESVLAEYEKTLEEVKKEYGENSKEALEYATKLNNQKAVVNKIKKEIAGYEDSLTEVSEAEKIAAKTGKSVADVLNDVGDEAEDAGDGFTVLKGAVANFAGNVMSSLVGSLKDAATNLLGLGEATREYRGQMSKLEAASKNAGYSTDYTKEKYKELYGILGDETAANTAVSNFIAMGAEEKDLNSLVNSAAGIWAKFGDSIPLDGLAEAINHTSQLGSVQGNLADALEWSGLNVDDFNAQLEKCNTEQERQKLITDTLNMVYGELGRSYKANNADVIAANQAQADYTDTMAQVGAKVEPITTKLKEGFNQVLQKILELVGDVDMADFTAKIEAAFKVLIDDVLPAIKEGLGWVIEHKDEVIAGLAGIAAGFLAFKVVTLIQGVQKAMEGMTIAQYALNLAMSLNPIGIIIALIAGLVAAFVVLWNKSEGFRNFFTGLWEGLKNIVGGVVDAIVGFFKGLWDSITGIFKGIGDFFGGIFKGAKDKAVGAWNGAKEVFGKVKDGITGVFSGIGNWFKNKFAESKQKSQEAWANAKEVFSKVSEKVKGAFAGIGDWFKNKFAESKEKSQQAWANAKEVFSKVSDKVKGAFSNIGGWFKDKFTQARENSKNAWANAKNIFGKVWNNVKGAFSGAGNWFKNTFSDAFTKVKNVFSKWGSFFGGLWDTIKKKFSSIGTSIANAIGGAVKSGINGVISAIENTINGAIGLINGAIGLINKIPGVELGKIKELQFPRLAKGGIVDSATFAEIGEAGREAVLPLENNTGWMRKLAADLVKEMNVGSSVTGLSSSGIRGGVVNNYNQTINSPKPLSRLDIYRQSKNLLGYVGGA